MELYRLAREPYSSNLSGVGSAAKGARWNLVGAELIYTASNRSLAMAEVAVHFSLATLPDDFMMLTIFVPDKTSREIVQEKNLPEYWNIFPHPTVVQKIGDKFVADNKHCLLQVPSAVTKGDYNILINPRHADCAAIKIIDREKFPFDKRIFK
jgi:RES domain-containing protein